MSIHSNTSYAGIHPAAEQLCIDDGMRPSQWWTTTRCRSGEQRLLLALLFDTYRILFLREGERRRQRRPAEIKARLDAIAWVRDRREDEDSPYVYSFGQVCGVLGLPTAAIRQSFIDGYRGLQQRQRDRSYRTNYNSFAVEPERSHHRKTSAA